ncbi:MAG: hypothetical protein A2521_13905 [Deltaproteobacteria bacterium RIFOXYD12_FULL_57_12]|nr:MAG: hypothetical protein A2521_13905 [Deltaproteobacteria bacterium RIFOXYD12_FULL_57_12]
MIPLRLLPILIFLPSALLAAQAEYCTPDRSLCAVVIPVHRSVHATEESIVEIRDSSGNRLSRQDYSSEDGEHGFGVEQARWTPDSRFFVYCMSSSGGHQAWHFPTYFYGRDNDRTQLLDDHLGPITDGEFKVEAPDIVITAGRRKQDLEEATFRVNLGQLSSENEEQ